MKTIYLLCIVVIAAAACVQCASAAEAHWFGASQIGGSTEYGGQVYLCSLQGATAPACGLLASNDLDSQRKKRGDEGGEEKKERKEEEKERHEGEPEAEEDDSGSCLDSFFGALFFSGGDDDDDDEKLALAPAQPVAPLLYSAVVLPGPGAGMSRTLWSDLGGEASGAEPAWVVMENTMLHVHKERIYGDETWLEVTVEGSPQQAGWIKKEYVEEYVPVEEEIIVNIPRWQLMLAAGGGAQFNNDLVEEYAARQWWVGGGARIYPNEILHVMIRGSHLKAYGDPDHVSYVTSTATEFPRDSRLTISRLSVMAGTYHYSPGIKGQIAWAAGPCLCRVAEEAQIHVLGTGFRELRVDELDQYRVGVDISVEFQWRVGETVPVFLDIGGYVIPVERNEEKSLTVDFLDSSVIGGLTFGFGIGYSVF